MTELLDHTEIPSAELAALFRRRWAAEVPLREIKMSMESDRLHCKSPEMGPQELWAGFLTHHLIRQSMLQATGVHGKRPEHLSFIASIQFIASTWLAAALASPRPMTSAIDCLSCDGPMDTPTALATATIASNPTPSNAAPRPARVTPGSSPRQMHCPTLTVSRCAAEHSAIQGRDRFVVGQMAADDLGRLFG